MSHDGRNDRFDAAVHACAGPAKELGDVPDQVQDIGPGGAANHREGLRRRVQTAHLQDHPPDLEERRPGLEERCLTRAEPDGNAQFKGQVSGERVHGAQLGQPAEQGWAEAGRDVLHHGLSVTKGCNKVVDRLWAGILLDVPRTIWKGALSFGLVNIPVGLYPATSDKSIHFNQFEEGTSDRIRYKKVNERTGEEVPQDRIVKGYDLGGGEFVILSEEELESAEPKKSRQIEISDFVGLVDIDPVFFRSSYYLAPEGDGADKAYALLRRAMAEAGRIAIATLVMRNKEYLVAIRPEDDALALHTMYFSDEVRAPGRDLELPDTGDVSDRELSMAQLLIESMESEWDPERFHDTHREKVEAIIDEKRQGHEIVLQEGPEPAAKVVDLMEALNASIAAAAKPGSDSKSSKRTATKRTTAKRAAPAKKVAKTAKAPARSKTAARRKAS